MSPGKECCLWSLGSCLLGWLGSQGHCLLVFVYVEREEECWRLVGGGSIWCVGGSVVSVFEPYENLFIFYHKIKFFFSCILYFLLPGKKIKMYSVFEMCACTVGFVIFMHTHTYTTLHIHGAR